MRMLCALRRLYVDRLSTVGGILDERYTGERLLSFCIEAKAYVQLPPFIRIVSHPPVGLNSNSL